LGERYEINAIIGRGGMGEVFLAHDRRLDNDVALKRLTPQLASSDELRESLRREAQIMARLSDSNIVRLFDLAEFFGDFYLILEYVPGPTLRDMIRAGYRASPQELALIMSEVCQGLTVAHNAGVIHRDLKPSNLLLGLKGGELAAYLQSKTLPAGLANAKVKISDFGIAKAIADSHLTMTNAISGTPGYMAPEQFRGEAPSPETDVYALGVLTYELLTGKMPEAPIGNIMSVPGAVSEVIRIAMSPVRKNRFPSAAAFYEALYNGIEGRSPRPLVPGLSTGAVLGIAGVCVAVLLGLITLAAVLSRSAPKPARRGTSAYKAPVKLAITPIDWHPFPKVTELPPIVEEARGKLANDLIGPEHPKAKWEITIPYMAAGRVALVGKDGTVYLKGAMSELCAIRDGKVVWAYKSADIGASIQDLAMDQDGRLWFKISTIGDNDRYCFNRDGKGGRLPRSFANQGPKGNDSAPYSCWKNKHTLSGPEGDMELEDDCLHVAQGRDGRIYVATDLPQILAVTTNGKFEFKYKPSCQPASLIPTLANQLVFSCADHTLHGLRGSTEVWNRTTDGAIDSAITDAAGTIYYRDKAKGADTGFLHAIDPQGKSRWNFELQTSDGDIYLGQRRMYLFQMVHDFSLANRLICISD
jgi:serine/threonine protein kinase